MPTYDYKCDTCGKTFEYDQRITEDALTHCPEEVCSELIKGKGEVHRVISKNVGLIFKGTGFYLTDYTNKNGSNASKSEPVNTDTAQKTKTETKTNE